MPSAARTSTSVAAPVASLSTNDARIGRARRRRPGERPVARAARAASCSRIGAGSTSAARRSVAIRSQSGSRPRSGSSSNSPTATPSTVKVRARRTLCACTPSTATSMARRPSASGATSVTPPGRGIDGERPVEGVEVRVAPWSAVAARHRLRRRGGAARRARVRPGRATRPAFHSLHAVGPVASESAIGRARRAGRGCPRCRPRRRPRRWSPGRRGRGRWRSSGAAGGGAPGRRAPRRRRGRSPSASATVCASTTPLSVWSPGPPLPRSCSSAPTSSRSGRRTDRTRSSARATASSRWRSTVKRWNALRCGLQRTRSHSGR